VARKEARVGSVWRKQAGSMQCVCEGKVAREWQQVVVVHGTWYRQVQNVKCVVVCVCVVWCVVGCVCGGGGVWGGTLCSVGAGSPVGVG